MVTTHVLKPGESFEALGVVTVLKCGLHSEGGSPPVPTVTLTVDDGEAEEEPAPAPQPTDE